MKLTILGSGSPETNVRRASSGYLIEIGDDRILLDCGGGVVDNLLRSGRFPRDITHLFFTHYHTDHMMDYARLVHAAWDEGAPPLKVFGPPALIEMTNRFFGKDGALCNDLRARTELVQTQQVWVARGGTLPRKWPAPETTEIEPNITYEFGDWTIKACSATHAEPVLTCYAYRIENRGKAFVYSGDTGINQNVTKLCRDADFLLHWCYRASREALHPALIDFCPDPKMIAQMAKSANVKRLFLTHFRVHMDNNETHKKAKEDMVENFGNESGIVEDLDIFEI